ncbi:HET-domain-containing protein [Stipitochalara longipes BDJ]|nr:HET-domain-containing protein [Stipitochalara longipes BDJ]
MSSTSSFDSVSRPVAENDFQLAKLCPFCQTIFLRRESSHQSKNTRFEHHEDIQSLKSCAEWGCALCIRLAESLARQERKTIGYHLSKGNTIAIKLVTRRSEKRNKTRSIVVSFRWTDLSWGGLELYIDLVPRAVIDQPQLDTSTGSNSSLAFAKKCLERCLSSHSGNCKVKVADAPTRLIELYEGGSRLFIPDSSSFCPPYTTLSHCWGTLDILKLKKENLCSPQMEIPMDRICKTFKDAMKVTRVLGFSYIWIDSLCIIQDDEEDWRREAALMSSVYGNSVTNIAASHAKDGSMGLFIDRDVCKVGRQYVEPLPGRTYEIVDPLLYERCLAENPLSSRAWAFQERFLAHRTLHFTAEQIFFECSEQTVSESWPEGIPTREEYHDSLQFPKQYNDLAWSRILYLYSRAHLSYSKDKLVALSGIAHHFQDKTGDQYIAGLWRNNLQRLLCWAVDTSGPKPDAIQNSIPYRAPSWSWASIDSPITWSLHSTNEVYSEQPRQSYLIDVISVELGSVGTDALGGLEDAKLQLRCSPLINSIAATVSSRENNFVSLQFGGEPFIKGSGTIIYDEYKTYGEIRGNIYFLPVFQQTRNSWASAYHMYGLMVTMASGRGRGYFRRLGVFDLALYNDVQHLRDLVTPLSNQKNTLMDESMYGNILELDENGMKQYVITLV